MGMERGGGCGWQSLDYRQRRMKCGVGRTWHDAYGWHNVRALAVKSGLVSGVSFWGLDDVSESKHSWTHCADPSQSLKICKSLILSDLGIYTKTKSPGGSRRVDSGD